MKESKDIKTYTFFDTAWIFRNIFWFRLVVFVGMTGLAGLIVWLWPTLIKNW